MTAAGRKEQRGQKERPRRKEQRGHKERPGRGERRGKELLSRSQSLRM